MTDPFYVGCVLAFEGECDAEKPTGDTEARIAEIVRGHMCRAGAIYDYNEDDIAAEILSVLRGNPHDFPKVA